MLMVVVGTLFFLFCIVMASSDDDIWGRIQREGLDGLDGLEALGYECYEYTIPYINESVICKYPNYWIAWTGTKCLYGNDQYVNVRELNRGGLPECWWLSWYFFWLWLALGVTTGLGVLGCCFGPLCGSNSVKCCVGGTGIGAGLLCSLISWPFMYCIYIDKIRCELCREKYTSSIFKFMDNSEKHRRLCLERNLSLYDDIPDSPLYACKTCEIPLKVWPVDKVPESKCIQCDNKIINDGTNLHVCFTCAGKGEMSFHHMCNSHTTQGNMLEVAFLPREKSKLGITRTSLELLPIGPSPYPQSSTRLHQHEMNKTLYQEHGSFLPPENRLHQYEMNKGPYQASRNVDPPAHPDSNSASNVLPPGWQVMTNPVTGAPYALCDPSGEIQSLIPQNTSVPPPYTEALSYPK